MRAGRLDLNLIQGTTYQATITVKDNDGSIVSLVGYEARLQIRETVDQSTILLSLTSDPAAGLTVNGIAGEIVIDIDSDQTEALYFDVANYDLEIYDTSTSPDTIYRLIEGFITLSKEVTR